MAQRNGYEDVEEIRDADGIVAVISKRVFNGDLSVAFMKTFTREGKEERTAFVQRRHLDTLRRMIPIVADRMDALNDERLEKERQAPDKRRAGSGG